MSRMGGAGAVAPLVTDIPVSSVEVIIEARYPLFSGFSMSLLYIFCALFWRKKTMKVEGPSYLGRSGRMMVQNGRLLNFWKKMLGLRCSFLNQRLSASCPSLWPRKSTVHNLRTLVCSWHLNQTHLHNSAKWIWHSYISLSQFESSWSNMPQFNPFVSSYLVEI